MSFNIRPIDAADKQFLAELITEQWGHWRVVTRGKLYDATTLPGFVATIDGKPAGLITYRFEGAECEIMTLNSLKEGIGVGTALMGAVLDIARESKIKRVWLITTNDNLHAMRFYQRLGFELVAVHRNAIEESRKLKPQIPERGIDGIPIRDEIELEMVL